MSPEQFKQIMDAIQTIQGQLMIIAGALGAIVAATVITAFTKKP